MGAGSGLTMAVMPTDARPPRPLVRRLAAPLLAGIVLGVAGACAGEESRAGRDTPRARAAESPEAAFRAQVGRTWELVRLGSLDIGATHVGSAERRPGRYPGPDTRPTIRFTSEPATEAPDTLGASRAGGWSFCNGYGAAYVAGPGSQLRFHQFQSTLVGCDGPDSLESRFFRALGHTRRFELGPAELHLVADDGSRLTFVPAPDSARPPSDRR